VSEAELARFIDRHTIQYVRTYPHPIERVWRAITEPAEISEWFWTATFDLRLGGAFSFGPADGGIKGVIAALDPPRLIRFTDPPAGPQGYFEFALAPVAGGTRMTFIQHGTPGFVADGWPWPGLLSGWHFALDHLGALLDGRPPPSADEGALQERYRQHALASQPRGTS
jgi:uncharacterized protein YndB with AHSA1/START domain